MPTNIIEEVKEFLHLYQNYTNSCDYLLNWATSIDAQAQIVQAHPLFSTALTDIEQAQVVANLAASREVSVTPVKPSVIVEAEVIP